MKISSIDFKAGSFISFTGECNIFVQSGEVLVVGALYKSKSKITVPDGKVIPFEIIKNTTIKVSFKRGGTYEVLEKSTIPKSWEKLVNRILKTGAKKVFVLGEVDTGKTFFTTYLANRLLSNKKIPSVIDLDIGQSDVGAPGTIGLTVMDKPYFSLSNSAVTATYFVGGHSPSLHIGLILVGFKKMIDVAMKKSDILLVDTSGFVMTDAGRYLKRSKMEILEPDFVVLMQRDNELEHLVKTIPSRKVVRLNVSKKATFTSADKRKHLRELLSIKYFVGSKRVKLKLDDLVFDRTYMKTGVEIDLSNTIKNNYLWAEKLPSFEGLLIVTDKKLPLKAMTKLQSVYGNVRNIIAGDEKNLMVGLLDKKDICLGLGSIEKIDYKKRLLYLYTPIKKVKSISMVQVGSLRVTKRGLEAGFVSPGSF